MKSKERKHLIDFFCACENKYPVDQWLVHDIHIWPVIKNVILFHLIDKSSPKNKSNRFTILKKVRYKLFALIKALRIFSSLKLSKSEYLFFGADSYRSKWKKKDVNRYFDPIMDYLADESMTQLFDYHTKGSYDVYRPDRVQNIAKLVTLFKKKIDIETFNTFTNRADYYEFLNELSSEFNVPIKPINKKIAGRINSILSWANLYEYILKRTQPKYAFQLCYYYNSMYGLNLAARKLGVTTIDMQHGTQGRMHPSYHFLKSPQNGYNILPDIFWVWDRGSWENINSWANGKSHRAILGGNPWIDFLKEAKQQTNAFYVRGKPLILYTLQPLPVMIDDYLLKVMATTINKYQWWLRIHPRMNSAQKNELNHALRKHGILDHVNIKEASLLPLPVVLDNTKLHISKFSGCIAEAAMQNIPTIVIDEVGINSYEHLMEERLVIPCIEENSQKMKETINNLISEDRLERKATFAVNYKKIIDKHFT